MDNKTNSVLGILIIFLFALVAVLVVSSFTNFIKGDLGEVVTHRTVRVTSDIGQKEEVVLYSCPEKIKTNKDARDCFIAFLEENEEKKEDFIFFQGYNEYRQVRENDIVKSSDGVYFLKKEEEFYECHIIEEKVRCLQ